MVVKKNKTRVMVTFNDEILEKLDEFCLQTGMNRSSYISYIVATTLDQYSILSKAAADGVKEMAIK